MTKMQHYQVDADIIHRVDSSLRNIASWLLKDSSMPDGEAKYTIVLILLSFHFEGYINLLGATLFPKEEWKLLERVPILDKVKLIAGLCEVRVDSSECKTIKNMIKLRNDLAHPKPQKINKVITMELTEEEVASLTILRSLKLHDNATAEFTESAKRDIQAICKKLEEGFCKKRPHDQFNVRYGWGSSVTTSASPIENKSR